VIRTVKVVFSSASWGGTSMVFDFNASIIVGDWSCEGGLAWRSRHSVSDSDVRPIRLPRLSSPHSLTHNVSIYHIASTCQELDVVHLVDSTRGARTSRLFPLEGQQHQADHDVAPSRTSI